MLVIKVELWPHGDESLKEDFGTIKIINDGTGDVQTGNYTVEASHTGTYRSRKGIWKRGAVKGFSRRLSPYRLICRALRAIGET